VAEYAGAVSLLEDDSLTGETGEELELEADSVEEEAEELEMELLPYAGAV